MEIGQGILRYNVEHDWNYPNNLAVLYEKGYLKSILEAKSLMTGKPYVYTSVLGSNIPSPLTPLPVSSCCMTTSNSKMATISASWQVDSVNP
ncbi:MAG: hypothetical protein M2R45_02225 [Verrucomicrobia subdivision 3 bacterium]|nr:hypothetical protein [Limisphaerales bacterium]MCS1413990.1 hypothetical protein [Limisphaerales bacterium]